MHVCMYVYTEIHGLNSKQRRKSGKARTNRPSRTPAMPICWSLCRLGSPEGTERGR